MAWKRWSCARALGSSSMRRASPLRPSRAVQVASRRRGEERVVRHAGPQQVRHAAGDLVAVELEKAGRARRRALLHAIEKLRVLQGGRHGQLNRRVEVVVDDGVVFGRKGEQWQVRVDVICGHGTSKRARQERIEEGAETCLVAGARRRARDERGRRAACSHGSFGYLLGERFERCDERLGGLLNRVVVVERAELVLVQEARCGCGVFSE